MAAMTQPRMPKASTLPAMISAALDRCDPEQLDDARSMRSRTSDSDDQRHGEVLEDQGEHGRPEERDHAWARSGRG